MSMIPSFRTARPSNSYDVLTCTDYDARIVRFIGLGVQDQPIFDGKPKDPAFKCAIQFELIGVDATGRDGEGKPLEPRPACQFKDFYLFPNAKRGNVFDLCKAINPSLDKVPASLEFFTKDMLGKVVNIKVGSYTAKDGTVRNKVEAITPIPEKYKAAVGQARCELVGFDPYSKDEDMKVAYSKLFKFQRDMLLEAKDSAHMPFAGTEPMKLDGSSDTKPTERPAPSNPATSYDETMGDDDSAPF